MYPGYALGTGEEVERAIDDGIALAVDISHVFIQITQGAMSATTWKRLRRCNATATVGSRRSMSAQTLAAPIPIVHSRRRVLALACALERDVPVVL